MSLPEGTVRRTSDAPRIVSPNGATTVLLAPGSATEHEYGLFEYTLPPGSPGAVPHFHRGFSETFYVLDGLLAVRSGDDWGTLASGDMVRVPREGVHAFRPGNDEPARFLILFSPAGQPREDYFAELAALHAREAPRPPRGSTRWRCGTTRSTCAEAPRRHGSRRPNARPAPTPATSSSAPPASQGRLTSTRRVS